MCEIKLRKLAYLVTLLMCSHDVTGININPYANYRDGGSMMLSSVLQANDQTAPYKRPQPLPATSFLFIYY